MSPLLILVLLLCAGHPHRAWADAGKLRALALEFNDLNTRIRDGGIAKAQARQRFQELLRALSDEYHAAGGVDYPEETWHFPLAGYDCRAIGERGHGYRKGGYDYFAGNRHGGHPSHDIFIRDRRQQSLDDVTGKPVHVLAMTGGVVVALAKEWQPESRLRGGKYLWIFDPATNSLVYYAHNAALHVELGDLVRPGDVIADVGRTGLNAHKKRSPTHLHLTLLSVDGGVPVARNPYRELCRSGSD